MLLVALDIRSIALATAGSFDADLWRPADCPPIQKIDASTVTIPTDLLDFPASHNPPIVVGVPSYPKLSTVSFFATYAVLRDYDARLLELSCSGLITVPDVVAADKAAQVLISNYCIIGHTYDSACRVITGDHQFWRPENRACARSAAKPSGSASSSSIDPDVKRLTHQLRMAEQENAKYKRQGGGGSNSGSPTKQPRNGNGAGAGSAERVEIPKSHCRDFQFASGCKRGSACTWKHECAVPGCSNESSGYTRHVDHH